MQHPFRSFSNDKSAARVAASKTSSTPSPVNEEHSRYFRAPICAAVSLPSLGVRNRRDFFLISSMATGSSRRSFFKPTRMIGTSGHRSLASSIHYVELVHGNQLRLRRKSLLWSSRCLMSPVCQRRILSVRRVLWNRLKVAVVRSLPDQQYPITLAALICHRRDNR